MANVEQDKTSGSTSLFREVESFNLFSQGNIYTTKIVQHGTCTSLNNDACAASESLLVGTLKPPKILNINLPSLECSNQEESFNCQYLQLDNTSEVNTELISFDMFGFDGNEKNPSPKDSPLGKQGNLGHLNICVTSVKMNLAEDEQYEKEFYLKIYEGFTNKISSISHEEQTNHVPIVELKSLATFQLEFIPYCLTHCRVYKLSEKEKYENVLLLSGSDDLIHAYRRNSSNANNFDEIEDEEMMHLFPEFAQMTPSPAVSVSFAYHEREHVMNRWSAVGCQDGQLQVFQVDPQKAEILRLFEDLDFAGIGGIHHAKFFSIPSTLEPGLAILNLIVVPSLERSAIYIDITNKEKQLELEKETQMLENSSDFDSVNACAILDIDGDGYPEIVLGTYGQQLMVYKISNRCNERKAVASEDENESLPKWRLWTKQTFSYPILSVKGWENSKRHKNDNHQYLTTSVLAVTSIKAIHILYYDINV